MPFDIEGRCHRENPGLQQPPRHGGGRGLRPEPHGDIDAIRHQITHLVAGDQLDFQLRVAGQEVGQARGQHQPREERVNIHAQPPAHGLGGSGGLQRGFPDSLQ